MSTDADNAMRKEYRQLSAEDASKMQAIKDKGAELFDLISQLGGSREISLAKTKVEESVMWAVKHITA